MGFDQSTDDANQSDANPWTPEQCGQHINGGYMSDDDIQQNAPDPGAAISFDNKADAYESMKGMTQNSYDPSSAHYCGPTALVAGAMVAGGKDGVEDIIGDIKPKDKAEAKELADLRAKAESGKLSQDDMHNLEYDLYGEMQDRQAAERALKEEQYKDANPDATEQECKDATAGVYPDTMRNFLHSDPRLVQMFHDNHVNMQEIDSDGDGSLNHYVLDIKDKDGEKIYDPYARTNGQIIDSSDPDTMKAYHGTAQINCNPEY
jgi:hypothetical protein